MADKRTTWNDRLEAEVWNRYKASGLDKMNFARGVSGEYGISAHGIRVKLTEMEKRPEVEGAGEYEQGDDFINIVCASQRMMTEQEVIEQFRVDMDKWEVERFKVKTSEGYRKDRRVEWKVENGTVLHGDVNDTGKMLVVPLYHIEVRFKRKVEEIRARLAVEDMKRDAQAHAFHYGTVKHANKRKGGMLLEIGMPDIHFGRLTWHEESGEDYDIKIAERVIHKVLDELLSYSGAFKVERILLPIGNDFYNVNSKSNTTAAGTPQQEDTRWQKTFRMGRRLAVSMVEACLEVAPTDVLIIKGNHDEERTFYMGDALECWFHACRHVTIDNTAKARKYYVYGCNLIGFTHGSEEKMDRLPMLMPVEVPELWAGSKHREIHCGDKHHKYDAKEQAGVVVRILRSLAAADAWTYQKGFVGAMRAAEGFLWDKENGLRAQFTAQP